MARYLTERREAVLKKLLTPHNGSVPGVAREEGIPEPTLYNWLKRCKSKGRPVPHSGKIQKNCPLKCVFLRSWEPHY
jgi:transposase